MKVEILKEEEVLATEIDIAFCFKFGSNIYMRVRNPHNTQEGRISAVNLLNGEVISLDKRAKVTPSRIEAVEKPLH